MTAVSSGDLGLPIEAATQAEVPPAESVRGKHVLVVGVNYWPEFTGIGPYTAELAEHLVESAASVTVLTGMPSYPAWKIETGYGGFRSRERRLGVNVVRLAHYVPDRQTAVRRAAYELTFAMHAITYKVKQRPDLVIAVTPALSGAVAGRFIARRFQVSLVTIVQDLVGRAALQSGLNGGSRVAGFVSLVERYALRSAARVAIVSESFVAELRAYRVPEQAIVRVNNWSRNSAPSHSRELIRQKLEWPRSITVAIHTGNMGFKQDLINIVDAARLSRDEPILWVIMGDGSQRQRLLTESRQLANVLILPPCEASIYSDVLAAADVLLVNEGKGVKDMSLPSKLTSYLAAGKPIIAASCVDGSTHAELAKTGAASFVEPADPQALVDAVRQLQKDRARSSLMGRNATTYASAFLSRRAALNRFDSVLNFD